MLLVRGDGGAFGPSRPAIPYGVYLTEAGGGVDRRDDESVRGDIRPTDPLLID